MISFNKKTIKDFFQFSIFKFVFTFIMIFFPLIHVREVFRDLVMIDMRPLTHILFFPYYKFINLFMQFIETHFSYTQDLTFYSIYPFLFFPFFLFYCYFLSCVFAWFIDKLTKQIFRKIEKK